MAIPAGTRLGAFEVLSLLGEGGMGQVYRARDTKLGREVALKHLPDSLGRDQEKLARLEREAHLLAALSHPNIATLHGLEESEGRRFLVMELVPGETLAERVARGSLGVEQSLSILRQLAEALEAAHEKGIIHRDLKPANVKVTPEGKVKLLDFGLAKAIAEEKSPDDLSRSPTLTREGTEHGVILGTASYMSPEQARGHTLDRRTDIWSFGSVLYEVLTGRKAFPGETVSDIIASILARDPDWKALPERTPLKIRDLLRRCLQRDPHRRVQHIGDARIEIEESLAEPAANPVAALPGRHTPVVVAALTASLVGGIVVWSLMRSAGFDTRVVSRFDINLPPDKALTHLNDPVVALSPDGTRLLYVGGTPRKLYVRAIDQMEATAIPGTEGTLTVFLSPDGRWAGFYGQGKLQKINLEAGLPVALCDVAQGEEMGASWGDNDTILFASSSGLFQVSVSGGPPSRVMAPDPSRAGISPRWPELLPGSKAALFTMWSGSPATSRVAVLRLDTGEHRVLIEGATFARFSPTGHLVYAREGRLVAAPFDVQRLEVIGPSIPLSLPIMTQAAFGSAQFALSRGGSIALVPPVPSPERTLIWVDRKGWTRPLTETRRAYVGPRLSPDGKRLTVTIRDDTAYLWIYDLERDSFTRLSTGPEEDAANWTPDGERVSFRLRRGKPHIALSAVDGSGEMEILIPGAATALRHAWSPDGRWLAFDDRHPMSGLDIWLLSFAETGQPQVFLQTQANERPGGFSPDGRWLAYVADESGRFEVYVQPFPGPGGKFQISTDGGQDPRWAKSGREIFYRAGNRMMVVEVNTEPPLELSKPKMLFEGEYWVDGIADYDVSPDGQRFLMIQSEDEPAPTRIHIILDLAEELMRKVPSVSQ